MAKKVVKAPEPRVAISTKSLPYSGRFRQFTTEASSVGLPAGQWPAVIDLRSHVTGNVRTFRRFSTWVNDDKEVVHVDYECEGMILRILND